ncbi:MAG: hypothetical protein IT288_05690 [Bdellovibrionales bacterium]|nr:hypothetical protein [Bdellovibrionales bacterium]
MIMLGDSTTFVRRVIVAAILVLAQIPLVGLGQNWQPESYHYEYNAGPMAAPKEAALKIINTYAAQPENKFISEEVSASQKFRYAFGAMMLRTNYAENTIKIFAIGQDAVDDAELVKLPGTGTGYSTRVQNIANHHGVDTSIATSNASFQTIKGQYGAFDHPYVELDANGEYQLKQSKYIDNYLWAMFNGELSPIVTHREEAWEWMLKNNPQSMRLIILFGGAAHDAFAGFLNKRGFRVPTRLNPDRLKAIKVPQSRLVYAGGNDEFPVLLTTKGKDLYQELLGRRLDYKQLPDKQAAIAALKKAGAEAIKKMKFVSGGISDSGVFHPGQLGGFDLNKVQRKVGNKWVSTRSLKGLKLSDGTIVQTDIAFVASPHPTSLSSNIAEASKTINLIFSQVQDLIGGDKAIEPDLDADGNRLTNDYAKGNPFKYGRAYLPRRVVPFGAPDSILRPKSSADRIGPQVLVSEPPSREELKKARIKERAELFDADAIDRAKNAEPVEPLNPNDIWSQHSRQPENRELADPGPGAEMAKVMVENLDRAALEFSPAPVLGFFAHYRGSFKKPRALIMYDSLDLEDRNTFRAATGARGQALNGLMRDLGVELEQLVLTTIPMDLTGADEAQISAARQATEGYREAVLAPVLEQESLEVIFTDGPVAQNEVARILKKLGHKEIVVINIPRGDTALDGIAEAGREAKSKLSQFSSKKINAKFAAIPIQHLPWNSRDWERVTSGTVIEANGAYKGKTYLVVTPNFVFRQSLKPLASTVKAVKAVNADLQKAGIPMAKDLATE